jgi:WD40 repeat protein
VPTEEEAAEAAEQQEAGSASGIQWSYFEALDRAQEVVRHRRDFSPGTMEGVEDGTGQGSNHFLKGVKWSPDGLCLLSNCDDNVARLYEVPYDEGATVERTATLAVSPGDTIFDFAWYPRMHSSQPASCCFATTSRGRPVHLWDAFTGKLRASYRCKPKHTHTHTYTHTLSLSLFLLLFLFLPLYLSISVSIFLSLSLYHELDIDFDLYIFLHSGSGYDDMDELTSALSVTFSASGDQVLAHTHSHTHTHTHMYTHTYTRTFAHTLIHNYSHAHTYTHLHIQTRTHMHRHIHTRVYTNTHSPAHPRTHVIHTP